MASPSMSGTAYVLFHHVMGETNGKRGVWGYVQGGMGGLTQALAAAARDLKVDIRCNSEVDQILVQDERVRGVALQDGSEHLARVVASNADAHVTFHKLLDTKLLPADFAAAVDRISYDSNASLKINVALSELPDFKAVPGVSSRTGRAIAARFTSVPDKTTSSTFLTMPSNGIPSKQPILECTIPSVGRSLRWRGHMGTASDGSMFIQYAPS